ncbi:MAG TPA: long-chain fatty acid--CoA ligase [Chloroflexota bacterium]|nr:long-chain fatty acid--CoA ligase [Chloroflexota bacterium]
METGEATAIYDRKPWLADYPPDVPHTLEYPKRSIWEALVDVASRYGTNTAFLFQNVPMTFNQVVRHAGAMSQALQRVGVRKGDVVLAFLPNVPHFPVTYYGALRLGAAISSAPPTSVEREIGYFLRDSGARTIVTIDLLYDKIANVWEDAGVERVIVGEVTDFMPLWMRVVGRLTGKIPKPKQSVPFGGKIIPMRSFLGSGRGEKIDVRVEPDDVAVLQYTGGTTGTPKAAMLTHENLLANAHQMLAWFPQVKVGKETILGILPFFHVYGLTLVMNAGLLLAARTILIAGGWVPSEVFEAIRRHHPTVLPGVPTLYVAILNDERSHHVELSSIDIAVCGGAPLPIEIKREFDRVTGGHLYEGYGLTEASPVTHAQPWDERGKLGSIGVPLPGTEARVVDLETGRPVPVGEDGELVVRGPQVMAGYWHRPEETADVFHDGWLHTGDIARMDADGYFFIVDRKKDLIITGGENIYPREVEEVLFEHPKVKEVAVVGIPHRFGGEIAKAFVVLKPGETATKRDIVHFASERLAKHKVPRAVEFRSELPKSPSGKVIRRVLAEEERAKKRESGEPDAESESAEKGPQTPVV